MAVSRLPSGLEAVLLLVCFFNNDIFQRTLAARVPAGQPGDSVQNLSKHVSAPQQVEANLMSDGRHAKMQRAQQQHHHQQHQHQPEDASQRLKELQQTQLVQQKLLQTQVKQVQQLLQQQQRDQHNLKFPGKTDPLYKRQKAVVKRSNGPGSPASASTSASDTGSVVGLATRAAVAGHVDEQLLSQASETSALWAFEAWFCSLVKTVSFAAVIKVLCMLGNVFVQISPFPLVKHWESQRDTGQADAAPYVAMFLCGGQWCFYGFLAFFVTKQSAFLILVHSNCLGAVLGGYYTFAFYKHCQCPVARRDLQRYIIAAVALVVFEAILVATLTSSRSLLVSGFLGSLCSFVGATALLAMIPPALRTGDSRLIPGALCTANLASSLAWMACGWLLRDPLVMAPNIISAFASVGCLALKVQYPGEEVAKLEAAKIDEALGLKMPFTQFDAPADRAISGWQPSDQDRQFARERLSCGTGGTL